MDCVAIFIILNNIYFEYQAKSDTLIIPSTTK